MSTRHKAGDSPAERSEPPGGGLPDPALAAQAIATVLRPLARLMIEHGLQLPSMLELLKKALVDEGAVTFGLAGKGSSDTRIALLTGVHRKDVKRLREAPSTEPGATPQMATTATSVVARWISEPRFLNADQTPRMLARTPRRGRPGEPDFTTLVAEVSSDVGARAVLDELERLGVVELRQDGYVALKTNTFVPREGLSESFRFLADNVGEHLAAAAYNLKPDRSGPPKLEQSAFSQGLSAEQAAELHLLARRLWSDALRQFLQMATVAEERSPTHDGPTFRVRFGAYFNETAEAPPVTEAASAAARRKRKRKSKQ